jgi:serine/threonine-protein kinase RsbW
VKKREIALSIDSRLENVSLVGLAVNRICEDVGFSSEDCYTLALCSVEAVSNSVRHAHGGEPGHTVTLRLTILPQRVEIRVLDDGSPVPLEKRAPRELEFDPEDPSSIPEGGRGLFLIHRLMDRVEYGREGSSNVLLMTKATTEPAG